jgi:hypothetical protein
MHGADRQHSYCSSTIGTGKPIGVQSSVGRPRAAQRSTVTMSVLSIIHRSRTKSLWPVHAFATTVQRNRALRNSLPNSSEVRRSGGNRGEHRTCFERRVLEQTLPAIEGPSRGVMTVVPGGECCDHQTGVGCPQPRPCSNVSLTWSAVR